MAEARTWVLTDADTRTWFENIEIGPADLGLSDEDWSIRKTTLRGGVSDGVDIIEVDNGALSFSVLPTRGMGIWKGAYRGLDVAWNSPVKGPVHPALVDLQDRGGLGWLGGFDEVVARCGLDSTGAPDTDVVPNNMGVPTEVALTLHGKIANIPARRVEVQVIPGDGTAPTELVVKGEVYEAGLFCPQYRLLARASTTAGSNVLRIEDEVRNEKVVDAEMELLYHCNFGPPFLDDGARLEVAAREVAPRDARAVEGLATYQTYLGPTAGYVEQVYWYDLLAREDGQTLAMLRNAATDKGLVLRFDKGQLPAFTQWKNTASVADGYVTGLEPATDYPNGKAFERSQGRLAKMEPGESRHSELAIEVLDDASAVAAVQAEIAQLQKQAERQVHNVPIAKYSDMG